MMPIIHIANIHHLSARLLSFPTQTLCLTFDNKLKQMKMKNLNKQHFIIYMIIAAITFLSIPQILKAQATYKLAPGNDVNIKVLGSSNIHDWTEISTVMESQGEFKFNGDGQLISLSSFNFSLSAKSLKSEHESMDSRTYKAMKADQYPKITFKLGSSVITPEQKNKYLIKATGDLTIAGSVQTVTLDVTAIVNPDNSVTCTGSKKIKLTDFKIDPPSFMLGAMKVTNDLTIQYTLTYKKSNLLTTNN